VKYAGLSGVLMGIGTLVRASALLLPVFAIALNSPICRKGTFFRNAAVLFAMYGFVLTPWILRNWILYRHFTPTTLVVGASLYEAVGPNADGGPMMDRIDWRSLRAGHLGEYEGNKALRDKAVHCIREDPIRIAQLAVVKFARFWNPFPNARAYRDFRFKIISAIAVIPVFVLAVTAWVFCRPDTKVLLAFVSPVLYYSLLHAVFVGSIRYRFPIMPLLMVMASATMVSFFKSGPALYRRKKNRRRLFVALAFVFLCVGLAAFYVIHISAPRIVRSKAEIYLSNTLGRRVVIDDIHPGLLHSSVQGLSIYPEDSDSDQPEIHVDCVFLSFRFLPLLKGKLIPSRIEVFNLYAVIAGGMVRIPFGVCTMYC
jgi:hypothetical protein